MWKRIFPSVGHFTDYILLLFHYNWLLMDWRLSAVWYWLLLFLQLIAFHCSPSRHLFPKLFYAGFHSYHIFLPCVLLSVELIYIPLFCSCLVSLMHVPCHSPSAVFDAFGTTFESWILVLMCSFSGCLLLPFSLRCCYSYAFFLLLYGRSSRKSTCFLIVPWK